jgi:hypothetical protein
MNRAFISLILLIGANYSYGKTYYGYAGSCNDGIYVFDFKNLSVTGYIQNRVIGSKWTYAIRSWTLEQKVTNKYVIWHETDDPAVLEVTGDASIIHGKSINNGYTFYYRQCEEKMAMSIIEKTKNYVTKSPKNKIKLTQ